MVMLDLKTTHVPTFQTKVVLLNSMIPEVNNVPKLPSIVNAIMKV
jgi:hypothetical protein